MVVLICASLRGKTQGHEGRSYTLPMPWVPKAVLPLRCLENTASCTMLTQLENLGDIQRWPSNAKLESDPICFCEVTPILLIPHKNRSLLPHCSLEFRVATAATIQAVQVSKNKIKSNRVNVFRFLWLRGWTHQRFRNSPTALEVCDLIFSVPGTFTDLTRRIKATGNREPGQIPLPAATSLCCVLVFRKKIVSRKRLYFSIFSLSNYKNRRSNQWQNGHLLGKRPWMARKAGHLGSQAERWDWGMHQLLCCLFSGAPLSSSASC